MALTQINRTVRLLMGQIHRCGSGVASKSPGKSTNSAAVVESLLLLTGQLLLVPARCLSQAAARPESTPNENEAVNPTFVNRNPRNLEQMALAVKDRGWKTTWPHQQFYHRLMFSRSQRHVTAEVFSCTSPVAVLTCSTKEWAVKKELASTNCVAACQAVGEVLAHRCQQAGIMRMVYRAIPWTYRSEGVQVFRAAMKQGGVILSEPRRKYVGT